MTNWQTPRIALLAALSVFAFSTRADAILIDDFTSVGDASLYPIIEDAAPLLNIVEDGGIGDVFGGLRTTALLPGLLGGGFDASDTVMTADVDTATGALTIDAEDGVQVGAFIGWSSDNADAPAGADITPLNRIVIDYSATEEFSVTVNLVNTVTGTSNSERGSEGDFTLPAAVDGQIVIPLADINAPVADVLNTPVGGPTVFFPAFDPTDLDALTLQFRTFEPAASLTLSRVEIIPEPTAVGLALVAASAGLRRRNRRGVR